MNYRRYSKILLLLITLGGCTVGPKYSPPEMEMPCAWHSQESQGMTQTPLNDVVWWKTLNDPVLNSLISRASEQNLDLYIAASRVQQARRLKKAKASDLYPHLDASVGYGHSYFNQQTLNDILGTKHCQKHGGKRNVDLFEIGFDADWEIDLFGKTAHEIAAMKAEVQAAEENVSAVWVTLSAEIARNYIELRGFQQQLTILTTSISLQQDSVDLTKELFLAGFASIIDLKQAENTLCQLNVKKPLYELGTNKAIAHLSILLGHPPAELVDELTSSCSNLPTMPIHKPIGVPSELLRRRPDIRKIERELAAATEQVGAAVASMFPKFSLRGFLGDVCTHLPSLLNHSSSTWIAGPQLLLPIFNSRLIEQDIQFNKLKAEQTLFLYQKTVLNALEETENAIASFHAELSRNQCLQEAKNASGIAYAYTLDLYQKGLKSYVELIATRQISIQNEEVFLESSVDLLLHYISLYKSLGGGWDDDRSCEEETNLCE